jgi:Ser/Thr protein kinase RdoA (MazF antagonist)
MDLNVKGEVINFTEERTRKILDLACRGIGVQLTEPRLLRHQTNAVYLVESAGVIVKIARPDYSIDHIHRTVDLTRWLLAQQFPTVPLCDVDQPVVIDGSPVTFWRYLPQNKPISALDIAGLLRDFHQLPHPPNVVVPAFPHLDAISAIRYSLDQERLLSATTHDFLLNRCSDLEARLAGLRYQGAQRLLHGDPQHANTLWDGEQAVLCDWESAVIGPVEWDLITVEVHCRRFKYPEETYQEFCRIYGRDVRQWDGYEIMRDIRELRMITTNARKSIEGSRGAEEVRKRVARLRRDEDVPWSIL